VRTSAQRTSNARTGELTATEAALLGLLIDCPSSGYDLMKRVQAGVGYLWGPAKSHLYSMLTRLERAGLASSEAVPQADRPQKSVFSVTSAGRAAFEDWLEAPGYELDPGRNTMLLKLFFADRADPETTIALVEGYLDATEATLAEYREIERRIAGNDGDFNGYLTLKFGLARGEASARWARETLAELRARSG
jgi:PadR family transcriptional regulator, regulatory protein AphA